MYPRNLPRNGNEREALRKKGQFWTPDGIAEMMVAYVLSDGSDYLFDPAVGGGAFFHAAKRIALPLGKRIHLTGTEIDPQALQEALKNGLTHADLAGVRLADFVFSPPKETYPSIVCNPPYIRHHRLSSSLKTALRQFGASVLGAPLDGRAGYHVYFLLRALLLLQPGGKLAFIMSADTCEGVFASPLWGWITGHYRLEAVITFTPEASPFPGVDINPVVFMIQNRPPQDSLFWIRCHDIEITDVKAWALTGFKETYRGNSATIITSRIADALATGLSRVPQAASFHDPVLGDFASVMRGIATGDNEYFFLTSEQVRKWEIPNAYLVRAIGRTRDVPDEILDDKRLDDLEAAGRPTWLFSPGGQPIEMFPDSVRDYLIYGEANAIHRKTLISTRRPWYRMETRQVPPILFAYLGRRNTRFIRNLTDVVPLTGFLCVYPHEESASSVQALWEVLQHPQTLQNLQLVGKSYGGGAIKVEPRGLEKLPLPRSALRMAGLDSFLF